MSRGDRFLEKYHAAVVRANKTQVEKLKPRIASALITEWLEEVGRKITDEGEFSARFEEFLTEGLGFAEETRVSIEGDELTIDIEGCAICPGNEILRKAGEPTLCPITPTGLMAISRVLGKKATLLGVDKEGKPVGFCRISYRLKEKAS